MPAPGPEGPGTGEPPAAIGAPLERASAIESAPGRPEAAVQELILRQIRDAVFATDLENRITYWSESAARLFGHPAERARGQLFGDLLPFRMAEPHSEGELLHAIAAGQSWRGEGTVRLPDGTELWIESTVSPLVVDGRITGSVSVSRDMTAARRAQRNLEEQERFVDAVIDVEGSLVCVFDRDGRIVRFNRACEQLTGYAADEVIGSASWQRLIPDDEHERVRDAFRGLLDGAPQGTLEHHWVTRDGVRRLVQWRNTALTDGTGQVTHVISTGIDVTDERRAADALQGIEVVGQFLAKHGPTQGALDAVLRLLADQMGYPFLALLLRDVDHLRLGAQLGYRETPLRVDAGDGIVGRVLRTGEPAFLPSVLWDPDYRSYDDEVVCEIAVPLRDEPGTVGVLNIESTSTRPLTEHDLRLAETVADRLASALALAREQQALADRARLFAALSEFSRVANSILQTERLWPALMQPICAVVPADVVILVTLDRTTGRYLVRASQGLAEAATGREVQPGESGIGRAIAGRTLVAVHGSSREEYPATLRDLVPQATLSTAAVPLIREGVVLGAISVARAGLETFSELEYEALTLLGSQAALALANARLMEEVSELAIRDALTGLYNRRHFDESVELILARARREREAAYPVSAIMFDLDQFGRFNKEHGHQAGDAVLRAFAGILLERLRSSDLVARYGGEEFVVILEGSSAGDAGRVAEEIRRTLESRPITGPDRRQLHATVSAGCAGLDRDEPTREALLRAADVALFMAKRGGRNRVTTL